MAVPSKVLAGITGLLIGLGLSTGSVLTGRTAENPGGLAAGVRMKATPTGHLRAVPTGGLEAGGSPKPSGGPKAVLTGGLTVSPPGRFISARNMKPGPEHGAKGSIRLANGSDAMLSMRARAFSSSTDLDDLLLVQIRAGGKRVFLGKLRHLRRWTRRSFRLAGRGRKRVQVRAWLPASLTDGYQARVANITFEWKARAVEE